MTAAAPTLPFPRPRSRAQGYTRDELVDLLAEARAQIADQDGALAVAMAAVHLLARRPALHDAPAEARILGALVHGRATLADVAGLEVSDFHVSEHAPIFAAVLRALRLEAALGVRVPPSARRDPARRAYVAAEGRRRRVGEALVYEGAPAAWHVLQALPRPATCPREAIATVRALGRWRRGE